MTDAAVRDRDRGFHQLDIAAEFDPWTEQAELAIEEFARSGISFTAEDVRTLVDDPARPGLMGAAFNTAYRRGLIECVGYRVSDRRERRGGVVRVWRGLAG